MVLVTGATGLLGSHLISKLTSEGVSIRALYQSQYKIEKVKKILEFYNPYKFEELWKLVEWINCDILDLVSLKDAMKDCVQVFHCAALVSFQKSDYYKMTKINRTGTANVVNLALELKVEKLIHVSSTAAIGHDEISEFQNEKTPWKNGADVSGYALSKYGAEKEVWRGIEEGLNAVIVNPTMILGAGKWNESSLGIFKKIDEGLKYITPGINSFVDARDVAEVMYNLSKSEIHSERFLLIGENISFEEAFGKIAEKMGRKKPHIKISKNLANFMWRLLAFVSFFTRKKPLITRETVKSAFSNTKYSAKKVEDMLSYNFRTLDEMIENTIKGRIK